MDRRTALKTCAAVLLAPIAAVMPKRAKAEPVRRMTIEVVADTTAFEAAMRKAQADAALAKPPVQGEPGKTYFLAGAKSDRWSDVHPHGKLYFNGVDVTNRTSEVDLVGGWAVMYDMKDATHKVWPIRTQVHHGDFEIHDPMPNGGEVVTTGTSVYHVRVGIVTGLTA